MTGTDGKMLTTEQVADRYHVTRHTVYKWVSDGDLHSHKAGRRNFFSEDDLAAFSHDEPGDEYVYLGRAMKEQRELSGMTVEQASEAIGIKPDRLLRIERGVVNSMLLSEILAVCRAYGCSADLLCDAMREADRD